MNMWLLLLLLIGGIIASFAGNEVIEQTLEYLEVFLLKTTPRVRGHSESTGHMMYTFYRNKRTYWYITGIGLVVFGWVLLVIGYHFGFMAIVEVDPSLVTWQWPSFVFVMSLAVLVVIWKIQDIKKVSVLSGSLSHPEEDETAAG